MSEAQVLEILHRASTDEQFSEQLFNNFDEALRKNNYALTPRDLAEVRAKLSGGSPPAGAPPGSPPASPRGLLDTVAASVKQQQSQNEARAQAQLVRANSLADYTVEIFKNTLKISARTYQTVTIMNIVMFAMGVLLFLFAAFYGVLTRSLVATATFGTLGAATFVTLFFLGPIEKTQSALSSLIQAEIAFMSYFDQITYADTYAALRPPGSGQQSPEYIAAASEMLQKRSKETIELLQIYVGHSSPSLPKEEREADAKAAIEQASATAKVATEGTK
jgi:ABC-type multidrug transport system fused ATPase/permease subunit